MSKAIGHEDYFDLLGFNHGFITCTNLTIHSQVSCLYAPNQLKVRQRVDTTRVAIIKKNIFNKCKSWTVAYRHQLIH